MHHVETVRLDARGVAELKQRVYGYMLATRRDKYEPWVRGIERYKHWALLAERYGVPLGVRYFTEASARVELIEAIYIAMRLVDDFVDKDAPLPDGWRSSVAYVEAFVEALETGRLRSDIPGSLLRYAFDIGEALRIDMRPSVRDILMSLHFDAKRQESPAMLFFERETLEHHFHLLDIRGTVGGCLAVTREPLDSWQLIEPLGVATRIRYNVRDLDEDLRARLCNIPLEDIERFRIRNVLDTTSVEMCNWKRMEALRGLDLLDMYRERKHELSLHFFTNTVLRRAYEQPATRYLKEASTS